MTTIRPVTPTYDNNGNLTYDGFYNYTWDGEGSLATLNGNAETYDALDRRVEQYNGSAYTEIVYGPAGNKMALMNGQTVTKMFAPLSAGATAVYTSSGLAYYQHPDWLGSSRIASTPSRTLYYDGAYAPFGENYAETGTADRNFTGQNQDLTPGATAPLYDFPNREQHSTQGRWISPDPAGIDAVNPKNPQSWNRYAYVPNNPLRYVDPRGLSPAGSDCIWNGSCNCTLDGLAVSCGSLSGLGSNGVEACPNNFCAGFSNGVYMQYTADANAVGFYSCLSTGSFATQQQAGVAAVRCTNGLSIYYNREYAGLIYQGSNGQYSFTIGAAQGPASATLDFDAAPDDTDFAGFYHTHGAFDLNYLSEQFSGASADIWRRELARQPGLSDILGNAAGAGRDVCPRAGRPVSERVCLSWPSRDPRARRKLGAGSRLPIILKRSKPMKRPLAVILVGSLLTAAVGVAQEFPRSVGFIDLLANRQQFDGTVVMVRAFLLVLGGPHDIASYFLCLNKEDAENQLGNDIWVSPNVQMQADREKFDRMYVEITGTIRVVRAANGANTVGIKDIRTCKVWSDPNRPILPKAEATDKAAGHR